jgi:polysaccharide biosynthesis/export protein
MALAGCNRSAIPGLTTPGFALATPAPFPPPPPLPLTPPIAGVPGVPANPYGTYRLDAGDRVRVIVFGQDNLSRSYSVDSNGTVSLPLIGPVRARGLTTLELSTDIAAELRRKYIKDPKSASRSRPTGRSSSWAKSSGPAAILMSTP